MNKSKILVYSIIVISIILCVPSVLYLVNNKTVDGFDAYYTYTLVKSDSEAVRLISGFVVIGLFLAFSVLYFFIVKKSQQIFKNKKQMLLLIMLISFIFILVLPAFSSDIYYYIGDSWLQAKYNQNPYYVTVADLEEAGVTDEILANTGYWKETTSVYGPLWSMISRTLASVSFGSVTIALFVFKLAAYVVHIANSYIIYKITKSTKYMLIYGLNPLVLMEFLGSVHNDIYLIFFVLLALYYLIRKKNIYYTILFLALSISIKFSTVLLVPFILIYYFRNQTIPKRILYCFISGISIIGIVVLLYLPYYQDYTIFTNMLVQGGKYSQSIMMYLLLTLKPENFEMVSKLLIPIFAIMYATGVVILLFKKQLNLREILSKYNIFMLIFIFVVLTNFQRWYVLWLLPTMIWQTKQMRQFILYITITAIIPTLNYFTVEAEPYYLGLHYSVSIIAMSVLAVFLQNRERIVKRYQQEKLKKV